MTRTSFTDHFVKVAADYASHRPTYPPELFAWLAEQAPARTLAWDCATGTGQAAVALADHFEQVWATDASGSQIAAATACAGVQYHTAPADCSGLPDQSVDLVTVAQALHWFDLEHFYAEVRRVLKSGGLLAVWTYGVFQVEGADTAGIQSLLDRFYYETVGACWPPERRHVENGYADLAFPFCELEPPVCGMAVDWTLDDLSGYLRSWSAVSRYREQHGSDPVVPLVAELVPYWGQGCQRVVWPLSIKVGQI
ncbi:MAG: class I SAM-dependent methyltransferase [Trichlorobacter sp.]|uniref:class I SAM-dependent methyltransferase n=1 Tax=Trichlorobacter sp. TaxID=2911007 RepID=UPI00255EBE9E|nr:class I SAM-dependent methyltransferase [Trichlorobacter sp.]MDK9716565.1 class I SAM-dependent methyltransferase [Trichlorobacter sp.]